MKPKIHRGSGAQNETFRTRFITAASLFDGHDASINIIRRLLQASGAEVIHLGHNQSVQNIVQAALHEDVQAIAISSYQGGHMEFFKYVIDLLKQHGASHIKVFGGGGGTIIPREMDELHQYGVCRIYSPENGRSMGLEGIINDMLQKAKFHPLKYVAWDQLKDLSTNPRALANALTAVEMGETFFSNPPFHEYQKIFESLVSPSLGDKSLVLGITGTGGAGKSSLIDELSLRYLARFQDKKIAILAIDPTRRKTGGALLGDRLRINSLANHRAFMRSLATRQENVSLSQATCNAVEVLKKAGFDWIIVETGGIGQADTSIVDLVDISIYVMTSEYGAATQLEKINMLDYADLVSVNKFDKSGSLDALHDVRKQIKRNHPEHLETPSALLPVFGTIASRFNDPGVDAVFDHLVRISTSQPASKLQQPKSSHHTLKLGGRNTAERTFQLLEREFELQDFKSVTIVPKDRTQYLSEIARAVRQYKEKALNSAKQAFKLEALETLLSDGSTLSQPSKAEIEDLHEKTRSAMDPQARKLLEEWPQFKTCYEGDTFTYRIRNKDVVTLLTHKSLSQNKIPRIALPRFMSKAELLKFLLLENLPGFFPYTAGVFPFKQLGEPPKRMFAGEGTPTQTNKRFHLLCQGEPAQRLSTAFDSVTLYGHDPDRRPDIFGKIGESGVSVCTLDDAKKLYSGFDLCHPKTSVSMTINGPAPMLLAFFFNTAIDQVAEIFQKEHGRAPTEEERNKIKADTLTKVRGTVQADILKEDQAQNTCIFSISFALKMMGDIQEYFVRNHVRNYYSVSISGYHIAEAGANPITQLAFTLANGFTFVEYYLSRGMPIDSFAPNLSFFFSNGLDPEYTVIGRVARRIWSIAMRNLYQGDTRSQKLKYHIQTSGRSLHAQEISFNDIRTTLQALLAYFDHCNSLHTNSYDEAVTTPTEESVRRAMAIQMIINSEFGWAKNENPLQGSFIIDELTELVEEAVLREFENLSMRGGVLGAMETHYQRSKIQDESLYYEQLKHSGKLPIIGVNTYTNPDTTLEQMFNRQQLTRSSYAEKDEQIENLIKFQVLHEKEAPEALKKLQKIARDGGNIFAEMMNTVRYCSLGQISRALYQIGGEYRRSI